MLSLCMIVKNEEKYLDGCLASVEGIVDEIILVDTGSSDATKEIASKYNAKIFDYKWCNDFASARNYSLEKAEGSWILYLDADERLSESSKKLLTEITKGNKTTAYECRIINVDEVGNRPSVMTYVRLFPKIGNVRFEGKVHEQIENSLLKANCTIRPSNVEILHHGYSLENSHLKKKAERNLEILLKEAERTNSGYLLFQIGQTYHILEDENKAIEYFESALKHASLRNEYKATALRSIAIHNAELNNYPAALTKIEKSLKLDPNQPLTQLAASKIFLKLDKKREALSAACKAYKLNQDLADGKISSSQSILADVYSTIYNGLNISILCGAQKEHSYFVDLLEKESSKNDRTRFLPIYKKLMQSASLNKNEIEIFHDFVDRDNIELIVTLLNNYKNVSTVLELLFFIEDKFFDNVYYLNYTGMKAVSTGNIVKAEQMLTKSIEIEPDNPSTILYLISVLVQGNKLQDAIKIISDKKDNFTNQPEVLKKFNEVLQRLLHAL